MTNPFAGQEPYGTARGHGLDHGAEHPGIDPPEPPDFSGWGYDPITTANIVQAWQEGVLAGREAAEPPAVAPPTAGDSFAGAPEDAAGAGGAPDAGLPGGVATPPAEGKLDWSAARVHTVKFWINAFIEAAAVEGPPGYGLIFDYEYFAGDNRGFSSDIHASSRLHSEIEITGVDTGHPEASFQWHDCGESHALNSSHSIVDTMKADARATFTAPAWDGVGVRTHYTGAANMPLISGSPDIDANGTFTVYPFTGEVSFIGNIDAFPWFEAYASVNNGEPIALFHEAPTGSGPGDLFGDAKRPVVGSGQPAVE